MFKFVYIIDGKSVASFNHLEQAAVYANDRGFSLTKHCDRLWLLEDGDEPRGFVVEVD